MFIITMIDLRFSTGWGWVWLALFVASVVAVLGSCPLLYRWAGANSLSLAEFKNRGSEPDGGNR